MESLYVACVYCGSRLVKVIQGVEIKIKDLIVSQVHSNEILLQVYLCAEYAVAVKPITLRS
jgi:hypothetical protein